MDISLFYVFFHTVYFGDFPFPSSSKTFSIPLPTQLQLVSKTKNQNKQNLWHINPTLWQTPSPGRVGQHKMNSTVLFCLCLFCRLLASFCFVWVLDSDLFMLFHFHLFISHWISSCLCGGSEPNSNDPYLIYDTDTFIFFLKFLK